MKYYNCNKDRNLLNEILLDSWNVGLHLQPFCTRSWATWLWQIITHFIYQYRKFLDVKMWQLDVTKDFSNNKIGNVEWNFAWFIKCWPPLRLFSTGSQHFILDKSFHNSYLYIENFWTNRGFGLINEEASLFIYVIRIWNGVLFFWIGMHLGYKFRLFLLVQNLRIKSNHYYFRFSFHLITFFISKLYYSLEFEMKFLYRILTLLH